MDQEIILLEDLPEDGTATATITDTIRKKAAALAASGKNKQEVKKQCGLSVHGMNKLYKDEEFKRLVADIGDDAIVNSKNEMKLAISRMTKKAIVALEKNLDKHSLEAVRTFLKIIGLGEGAVTDDKGGGFTLVLANQKPEPQTIVVKQDGDE